MYLTENFEPRRVLERFEDICAIPHGSGHEQALGDWVMALAEKRGHEAIRDAAGNILVRVAASPGCEAAPPILLQGHLDMVLAQEEGLGSRGGGGARSSRRAGSSGAGGQHPAG